MLFSIYRLKLRRRPISPRLFFFPTMSKWSRRRIPLASRPNSARQRELNTKRRGELAELTFVLKAASLGFGVARPYGDSERYDVILDARDITSGVGRADVARAPSSATLPKRKTGNTTKSKPARLLAQAKNPSSHPPLPFDPSPPLWRIQIKCSTQLFEGLYRVNAHRRTGGRAVPYLPGEIDFLAAYIIPEDTWYIIPLQAFHGSTGLLFRRRADRKPGRYDAYREAWRLLRPT